ncbi:LamG-like jellyroll fold domain-containing protein [Neolewinella persica]|uniref:LamG-like jellyroll fold domain-containing protein n=1 Tax=Neolewinella persica TaxID=70998 RepID=UPI000370D901|nr:LamG-like jellyroll fold domain-containing protein [Neolewinella persica]
MRAFLLVLFIFSGAAAGAIFGQGAGPTTLNLVAHYTFDGDFADATGDSANNAIASGVPEFGCGVEGDALILNGGNDFLRVAGGNTNNVNRVFGSEDFTISFSFKPVGVNGTQFLMSKRDTSCNNLQFFTVRYAPLTRTVSVILQQNNQQARIDHRINNGGCWQHLVIVRDENSVLLFLNAQEVGEARTSSRVDVENNGEFLIGSTVCRSIGEIPFDGLIDEVRVYDRALRLSEVRGLYSSPDQILTENQRVFLGESVDVEVNSNCGISFNWTPPADVINPTDAEPTITPVNAGRQSYLVRISDMESNCTAIDSLVLQVIDPSALDCGQVFLPKAFTPNGIGPTANENFGISNPFAIPELLSFEIYDRYGAQMFQSADAFARWDGTFKGDPVQPGPIVWRVVFNCNGRELVESGSAMILR